MDLLPGEEMIDEWDTVMLTNQRVFVSSKPGRISDRWHDMPLDECLEPKLKNAGKLSFVKDMGASARHVDGIPLCEVIEADGAIFPLNSITISTRILQISPYFLPGTPIVLRPEGSKFQNRLQNIAPLFAR